MAGGMFFLGSEIVAEPLKDYDNILDFFNQIYEGDSVKSDLAARIQESVDDGNTPFQTRVYILYELDELLDPEEKQEGLQDTINDGIQNLLEQISTSFAQNERLEGLPEGYNGMNLRMQFAHMLWLSQTVNCAGAELKENWDASCLQLIYEILQKQEQRQDGNEEAAEALYLEMKERLARYKNNDKKD